MRPSGTLACLTLIAALALAAAALCAGEAQAQCALCRTALQDAGETTARAMNLGILVLLVPPVAIFCAIFAVAYKKGKGSGQ
ncbi:MAG: hypothetical protein M3416_05815 [Acidobacteriota bacterium]|nr:hypothetical protein [Acidobacteriota bacterium]